MAYRHLSRTRVFRLLCLVTVTWLVPRMANEMAKTGISTR